MLNRIILILQTFILRVGGSIKHSFSLSLSLLILSSINELSAHQKRNNKKHNNQTNKRVLRNNSKNTRPTVIKQAIKQ